MTNRAHLTPSSEVIPKIFEERSTLQVRRVERVALAEIAGLVAAAKPAHALFGTAVRK